MSMTLIMDRALLEIGDDARDIQFEDESCVGYDHDSQHVAITTTYDRCGTTQKVWSIGLYVPLIHGENTT